MALSWIVPEAISGMDTTVMDTSVAELTFRVVVAEMLPMAAVIDVEPAAIALAMPSGVIVATELEDELQVTEDDRSCVVPSESVPVTSNFLVVPLAMVGFDGIKVMEVIVAEDTLRLVVPDMLPEVALITVVPAATALALPSVVMVALDVSEEFQVTPEVRTLVVPSEYAPVAVNCWAVLMAIVGVAGVIFIEFSVIGGGSGTSRVVVPEISPKVAVIVVLPTATAVAIPLEVIVATEVDDELQITGNPESEDVVPSA